MDCEETDTAALWHVSDLDRGAFRARLSQSSAPQLSFCYGKRQRTNVDANNQQQSGACDLTHSEDDIGDGHSALELPERSAVSALYPGQSMQQRSSYPQSVHLLAPHQMLQQQRQQLQQQQPGHPHLHQHHPQQQLQQQQHRHSYMGPAPASTNSSLDCSHAGRMAVQPSSTHWQLSEPLIHHEHGSSSIAYATMPSEAQQHSNLFVDASNKQLQRKVIAPGGTGMATQSPAVPHIQRSHHSALQVQHSHHSAPVLQVSSGVHDGQVLRLPDGRLVMVMPSPHQAQQHAPAEAAAYAGMPVVRSATPQRQQHVWSAGVPSVGADVVQRSGGGMVQLMMPAQQMALSPEPLQQPMATPGLMLGSSPGPPQQMHSMSAPISYTRRQQHPQLQMQQQQQLFLQQQQQRLGKSPSGYQVSGMPTSPPSGPSSHGRVSKVPDSPAALLSGSARQLSMREAASLHVATQLQNLQSIVEEAKKRAAAGHAQQPGLRPEGGLPVLDGANDEQLLALMREARTRH